MLDLFQQNLLKRLLHLLRHKNPGAIRTNLPGAEEIRHHSSINRTFNISIRQHNHWTLPSQLHRHILHLTRRTSSDLLSCRHLPSKAHLRHTGVAC